MCFIQRLFHYHSSSSMRAFVTVGTTRFDALINAVLVDRSLSALSSIGVRELVMQIGAGLFDDVTLQKVFGGSVADEGTATANGITISYYRYKPSISEDMEASDLVIGHAGAGTALECLRMRKPLIVVINDLLMDNHQLELADALAAGKHLIYCTPNRLEECISDPGLFSLSPYTPPDLTKVARLIDSRMGLTRAQ